MAAPSRWDFSPKNHERARTEAPPPDWVSAPQQPVHTNAMGLPADHPFHNYGREQAMAPAPDWHFMSGTGLAGGNDNVFAAPTAENFQNVQNLIRSTGLTGNSVEARDSANGLSAGGTNNNVERSPTQGSPLEYSDAPSQQQDKDQDQPEGKPEGTISGLPWYIV